MMFSARQITTASVEQTQVSQSQQPSMLPTHTIAWIYVVMSRVHWHAMQQIIMSSLTTASHFHDDAPEHEKGWSSRSSNRVE